MSLFPSETLTDLPRCIWATCPCINLWQLNIQPIYLMSCAYTQTRCLLLVQAVHPSSPGTALLLTSASKLYVVNYSDLLV